MVTPKVVELTKRETVVCYPANFKFWIKTVQPAFALWS